MGGGIALIVGAVLVLRDPDAGQSAEPEQFPAPRTTVQTFADASVLLPQPGARPKPPRRLEITARENRLVVGWGQRHTGLPEPDGAAGYEVRWGSGDLDHTRFVAGPVIQLDGLRTNRSHAVEVRTVDSFGRRSDPVRAEAVPLPGPPDPVSYAFADRFTGTVVPDPVRWHLVGTGNCTKAAKGDGEDARRLVITGQCGSSDEEATLRSRAPLRLLDPATAPNGELGRLVVETDRPAQSGDLTLDLVPGPVDLIGAARSGRPVATVAQQATVDPSLPPGAIRVRISGQPEETGVQVLVAPGTPLLGRQTRVTAPPRPELGVSVRWEVVLRTDGVQVLRDGVVVAGGDVVPSFTEATALIGFTGGLTGLRAGVDLIGFAGASTTPPPLLPTPRVDFDRTVAGPGAAPQTSATGPRIPGVRSGQLRVTLVPQRVQPGNQYTVDIGGREIPARPAIAGQPMLPGVRLPLVADVPADALVRNVNGGVSVAVRSAAAEGGLASQVLTASLELAGDAPSQPASRTVNPPLPRGNPTLPTPEVMLHDAAGTPVPPRQEVPRGRMVLDVVLDPSTAQRVSGAVAGLAGIEIGLDNKPLAAISTAADGPGVGGSWRIAVDTTGLRSGGHTIQVSAVGADVITAMTVSYASFVLR
ncbi:MAG TPA: hypothetical protein VGX25_11550 [Actinophytocola sp.]|uniref:hypothetical protein n=1 Tax=Actinophytocola sp. TaxID=1872138 RepID=UPI002DDCA791|nr:hypothetical protein [Actinophytocola sp.]HEV2780019.1 hypothetical protein [Actinophytocola sp.]